MAVTTGYPPAATTMHELSGVRWTYQILHMGFAVLPIIAGVDKFFGYLTYWEQYLSPTVTRYVNATTFMQVVGVVEILAGLIVAFSPRIGGYIVGLWLMGIIVNLLTMNGFYDIALRDFGLMLGAFALAQLAQFFKNRTTATSTLPS
jgi:hypothetical protein